MSPSAPSTTLSSRELQRYARQILLNGWGEEGQARLKNSTVFIAGAGGLGSPVGLYLAAAGVGRLRLADFDNVDWSNLNRQILHDSKSVGREKAASAQDSLERMNPDIDVTAYALKIDEGNVDRLVGDAAVIVDAMDNFPTRFLLDDCARRKGIPLVHGAVWGMDGRLTFIHAPETPCLRCLYREAPPREVFPVAGPTPGVIGSLQALEVLKHITGVGETLRGKLLVWDGANMDFQTLSIRRDPACPACRSRAEGKP